MLVRLNIVDHRWWNCLSRVAAIKCWHFTCTYLIHYSYNTRYIIFTLHVNGLTFMAQCDIARVGIVPRTS